MLTRRQWWFVAATALVAACAIAAIGVTDLHELPTARLSAAPLRFEPVNAMAYTAALSMRYPHRVTGTASSRTAAGYIAGRLRALGYHVALQRFSLWYDGKRVEGQNVVATLPRTSRYKPYVAVLAHYDSPRTAPYAAEDDASGVGTMLELARVARYRVAEPIFVATDAEELGMLGAHRLAAYLKGTGTGSAISIDYVNAGEPRGLEITASGQFGGYTPLWLRGLASTAQAQQSEFVRYPSGLAEWVDRAVNRSFQDQGPLLQAGIPAVNLGSVPIDRSAAMARYHTANDVYANFTPRAFAMLGRSAERLMLTLAQPNVDRRRDGFLVSPGHAIPLAQLWWMQFFAIVPLIVAFALVLWNMGVRATSPRRFFGVALLALPPLAAYALCAQLAQHDIMLPRFELYPPPPKDPLLYHPPAMLVLAIAGVLLAGYAALSRWKTPVFDKSTLFAWTVVLVLAAFVIQPYGMWLYLGIFAYTALFFVERPGRAALVVNLMLCALSAVPFAAVLTFYASEMWLGPYVLWYLVLQSAYGVWSFWIAGTAIAAAVLWVQFVRLALANAPAWTPSTLPKPRPAAPMSGSAAS